MVFLALNKSCNTMRNFKDILILLFLLALVFGCSLLGGYAWKEGSYGWAIVLFGLALFNIGNGVRFIFFD